MHSRGIRLGEYRRSLRVMGGCGVPIFMYEMLKIILKGTKNFPHIFRCLEVQEFDSGIRQRTTITWKNAREFIGAREGTCRPSFRQAQTEEGPSTHAMIVVHIRGKSSTSFRLLKVHLFRLSFYCISSCVLEVCSHCSNAFLVLCGLFIHLTEGNVGYIFMFLKH